MKCVVDSSPFFEATKFLADEQYFTVPHVIAEIKDRQSKQNVIFSQDNLIIKMPTQEAVAAVSTFARKTGDYFSLSTTDILVLALTWMLEKEDNGIAHLRTEPVPPKMYRPIPKQALEATRELTSDMSAVEAKRKPALPGWVNDGDDDLDAGWITPLDTTLEPAVKPAVRDISSRVACMTSDYAMQNVLLQMKLKLVSTKGKRIKYLKAFILRCHACFKTTKNMDSKFCGSCGNNTLIRTSVGIDSSGNTVLYLKQNFQYNNRGTIYHIPTPKGGRKNTDLMLREDSRDYQKALKNSNHGKGKETVDLFDPDRVMLDGGKWATGQRAPVIGYGRKNINGMNKKR